MKNPALFLRTLTTFMLLCLCAARLRAQVVINEIHYRPLKSEAAGFVELHNAGVGEEDLSGWKFTAGIQFTFASETKIGPGGFLVIAADTNAFQRKFGSAPAGVFRGKLSRRGDHLVLKDASGAVRDEVRYKIGFPWPVPADPAGSSIELIHPKLDNALGSSWRTARGGSPNARGQRAGSATPGARNSEFATKPPPGLIEVRHSPEQPRSGEKVGVAVDLNGSGPVTVTLEYQIVEPGRYIERNEAAYQQGWISVAMSEVPGATTSAARRIFAAAIPGEVQRHRRLVRYRVKASSTDGGSVTAPFPDDPQPNFAYFVYDGVPPWRGAINPGSFNPLSPISKTVEFGTNVMRSVPVYHLIAKKSAVETAQWREQYAGKEYKWIGTLVQDGKVYDHIHFRARGGSWRYAMGKNMWKFAFNLGHEFAAKDHFGRAYREPWGKLNLGACIQQGDYGHRGEQGMFESVGFRLFNLAGVEAPRTHFVQLRVIDDAAEARSQYAGDFWGLYLAVEQMDGHFLNEHTLPDGNLFKMQFGSGEMNNQGAGQPLDRSDLTAFMRAYRNRQQTDDWWRRNFDLPRYYSYRAIVEAIHHYDIDESAGKNYFYFRNPDSGKWSVHPWDIDLTWADSMFGGGSSPFRNRVLPRPAFRVEYQNRLREIRDLLFNPDQCGQLIDEYAAVISDPKGGPGMVQADRALWDYNPVMNGSMKSAPGLFYQASPTGDFAGMVRLMKGFVVQRGRWIDRTIVDDPAIPTTPTLRYTGPKDFHGDRLRFESSPFNGQADFAAIEWRIGEVSDPKSVTAKPVQPRAYEISAVWESREVTKPVWEISIPAGVVNSGHVYRARVRMKDATGRSSHWSAPVEFSPGG